jgi:peptidoglycan/LPS O-acetylase OafA/YrhL
MLAWDYASRSNNFDLIRLIAASQVFFSHFVMNLFPDQTSNLYVKIIFCFPGVAILFVISGFLVSRSLFDTRGRIVEFAWRRALRIYPGLWTNLTIIIALLAITGDLPASNFVDASFWRWVLGFYFTGFGSEGGPLGGVAVLGRVTWDWGHIYHWFPSGVLWTISVELGFYVLLPIVLVVSNRKQATWSILICAAILSLLSAWILRDWRASAPHHLTTIVLNYSPAPYFWIFLIGVAIAYGWALLREFFVNKAHYWIAAYGILCWADNAYFGNLQIDLIVLTPLTFLRIIVLACLIISLAYTLPRLSKVLHGIDLSYGIYLYHMLFIMTLKFAGIPEPGWLLVPVVVGPIVMAAISWFFIERPALQLKHIVHRPTLGVLTQPPTVR